MKTKVNAAKILLNEGWTESEVKSVLGSVPKLGITERTRTDSPWWVWSTEDWYTPQPLIEMVWMD